MSANIRFLQIYNELERVVNSKATWETKYDLCFGYRNGIYDRMVRTGVSLIGYIDPDTTQKKDVLTFYAAAKRTAERIEIEIGHKVKQNDKTLDPRTCLHRNRVGDNNGSSCMDCGAQLTSYGYYGEYKTCKHVSLRSEDGTYWVCIFCEREIENEEEAK